MKSVSGKLLCSLLALLMLLAAAACSNQGSGDESVVTTMASADTDPAETESPYDAKGFLKDDLPADLNYKDQTFSLLYWSDREHEEFVSTEVTGDMVSDALYQRNLNVENRLSIKLNFVGIPGNASNTSGFLTAVENAYKAGNHDYDMVAAHSFSTGLVASNGLLLDLNTCDNYLDLSKPWWPATLINEATIGGKLFFASGDISANVIYMMYVTFFNKTMLDNLGLESPYDLVANNQWTIDKMFELCDGIYEDSNGNGKADIGDTYGQYAYTLHLDAFLTGSGIKVIETNGSDMIISPGFYDEKADSLTKKLSAFFSDHSKAYLLTENKTVHQYFSANQSLFWNDRCRNAITFKEKDTSFGIVPNPKYDADQPNFCTVLGNPFSLYGIVLDNPDVDRAAAVMECYASESYREVSPALYEITMKYRFTDDAISAQMFDLARSTVIFDMGRIFASSLNSPFAKWENCVAGGSSWSVNARGLSGPWKKQVEELNDLFK